MKWCGIFSCWCADVKDDTDEPPCDLDCDNCEDCEEK